MNTGEIAPNFILKDENGNAFELYKNLDTNILLAFYPKDDTRVCSIQLSDYNENLHKFNKIGIRVIGISTDSVESHSLFSKKLNLNFPLLADIDKKVCKKYDAINFLGMSKRLLVLIGTDRKIIWINLTIPITYFTTREILEKVDLLNRKKLT